MRNPHNYKPTELVVAFIVIARHNASLTCPIFENHRLLISRLVMAINFVHMDPPQSIQVYIIMHQNNMPFVSKKKKNHISDSTKNKKKRKTKNQRYLKLLQESYYIIWSCPTKGLREKSWKDRIFLQRCTYEMCNSSIY